MIKYKVKFKRFEEGAVSLFVVIFTSMLFTVISLSYANIMLKDQQQSLATNLSQAAYDAAMSGVEDAKRLLVLYRGCVDRGDVDATANCARYREAVASEQCNAVEYGLAGASSGEYEETKIKIKGQDNNERDFSQAYTCAKIKLNTPNFELKITDNDPSKIVPLYSKNGVKFKKVRISWFNDKNLVTGENLSNTLSGGEVKLDQRLTNGKSRPTIRMQLVDVPESFRLSDYDRDPSDGRTSKSNALFLYPRIGGVDTSINLALADNRKVDGGNDNGVGVSQATCKIGNRGSAYEGYFCRADIELAQESHRAFLFLKTLYRAIDARIELLDQNGNRVDFDGVQPGVDVTARANERFRRVVARVEFGADFKYPEAAITSNTSVCKAFSITDRAEDFEDSGGVPEDCKWYTD